MLVSHDRACCARCATSSGWWARRRRPFDGDLDDYQRYLLDEAKRQRDGRTYWGRTSDQRIKSPLLYQLS
jgi:ATP-binding cassette subfamily F protein 3